MSVSAEAEPFGIVVADMAYEAGVDVVVGEAIRGKAVTVDLESVTFEVAVRALAREAEAVADYRDGIVVFDAEGSFVEAWTVIQSSYLLGQEMADAVRLVIGSEGEVQPVGPDRVVVAGSRAAVRRAEQFERQLSGGPAGWLLDVLVVEVSTGVARELGLGWTVGGTARVEAATGAGTLTRGGQVAGAEAALVAEVVGQLVEDNRDAQIVNRGTLYLLEGTDARLLQGDRLPIAKRQTSPEGTVAITGFEYVDTGFELEAEGRSVPGGLRLELRPSISEVTGFVADEAPILVERSVDATVVLSHGEWLVLSGLERWSERRDASGLPGARGWLLGQSSTVQVDTTILLVMVRATRVFESVIAEDLEPVGR